MGFLFYQISSFRVYYIRNSSFWKTKSNPNKPIADLGDKGFYTISKNISPKVNVITRLEFEHAYFTVAVLHFRNFTTVTLPCKNVSYELERISPTYVWLKRIMSSTFYLLFISCLIISHPIFLVFSQVSFS